jgi:hypothetical protein
MTTEVNKHGLSRKIPSDTRRAIRRNSKFGCIVCRRGVYAYEHIDPLFKDAKTHDPLRICGLCGACHELVTRGHYSKEYIQAVYDKVRVSSPNEVGPPIGPLDFYDGSAVLEIGGLRYSPVVNSVLVYHGIEVFGVYPSTRQGTPGHINAVFTDEAGEPIARISVNGWEGAPEAWDIEVEGSMITVRRKQREIALRLVLRPPGLVVVDRLDMRFGDAHILVASGAYAVGRYVSATDIAWVHARMEILKSSPSGRVVDFTDPEELKAQFDQVRSFGQAMVDPTGNYVVHSSFGAYSTLLGISIGRFTGSFAFQGWAGGVRPLEETRRVIVERPERLDEFLATGRVG